MVWGRFDDQYPDHPKVVAAGQQAAWLNTCAILYCARYLTDGFVPAGQVRKLADVPDAPALAERLIAVGLWERDPDGFRVHDYLDYNPSREQVQAERQFAARRKAMNANPELTAAIKLRDQDRCRYCGVEVNWRDRKGPGGGTYDHVVPITAGGRETVDNLVVCCRSCNERKNSRNPDAAGMRVLPPPSSDLDEIWPESSSGSSIPVPTPVPVPVPEPTPAGAGAPAPARETPAPAPPPATALLVPETGTDAALAEAPAELTPAERDAVRFIRAVPGLERVPAPAIVGQIRDARAVRGFSDDALRADALRFRDEFKRRRAQAPPGDWAEWGAEVSRWFLRTQEPLAPTRAAAETAPRTEPPPDLGLLDELARKRGTGRYRRGDPDTHR